MIKFDKFSNMTSTFMTEHNKFIKEFKIDFLSIKGTNLSIISLYKNIYILFKNSSINIKNKDIVLLTITSIGMLSKENKDIIKILIDEIKKRKLLKYLIFVKNSIKSFKNLINIINKKDGTVIQNIEQAIKNKNTPIILGLSKTYLKEFNIKIEDFNIWFISDKRIKFSKNFLDYIIINYYL